MLIIMIYHRTSYPNLIQFDVDWTRLIVDWELLVVCLFVWAVKGLVPVNWAVLTESG